MPADPDGNLWVIEYGSVAKVSTAGVMTLYPLLTGGGWVAIAPGPDGNIWFSENNTIGYVTPSGIVTELPGTTFSSMIFLNGIVTGPDGALWLTAGFTSNLGRLTTTGQLTNTYALSKGSGPNFNTLGPDGAVWFTESLANSIGRIGVTGAVTSYSIPTQRIGTGKMALAICISTNSPFVRKVNQPFERRTDRWERRH